MRGDETIRDIIGTLANAEEYVRQVLGNMAAFRKDAAEPMIRIGVTGDGIVPYYRIEPFQSRETDHALQGLSEYIEHMKVFNGRSHRKMEWTAFDIQGGNWSSGYMTFKEVQQLLGDLRGFNRKK